MVGVPCNVAISGSGRDSEEDALGHLLGGLRALGFADLVNVEDATRTGPVERFESRT